MKRRVVITGLGLVTPIGTGVETVWRELISGASGVSQLAQFDASDLACTIGAQVAWGKDDGEFDPEAGMNVKDLKRVDKFIAYGMVAGAEALQDSGLDLEECDRDRAGVMIGSGIGGIEGIAEATLTLEKRGPNKISPFFVPGRLINMTSGYFSIAHGLRGPNHSAVTACATGTHAIGDSTAIIARGDADIMFAGGSESPLSRLSMAGFCAARALSTNFNDRPTEASRPYDRDRDGFVMGEGAGVVVLEELEHAKRRGAKIYGEILGYGMSGDAWHITAPSPNGDGAMRCMAAALTEAGREITEIDYINSHGTSTLLGDEIEVAAVESLIAGREHSISMSSTKSSIGHLLGAAGAVEAIFALLAMRDNVAPATLNLHNPSFETSLDLIPLVPRERKIDLTVSNSFGFGGTNASLVIGSF